MDVDKLRIICGPTAAGKSTLALRLAERFGATIVSADSRQIYIGFDVGTAKPSVSDRARVPHRGIDVVLPTDRYSAVAWATAAATWIREVSAVQCQSLVVGGTGFYVSALVAPVSETPPLDAGRRGELESILDAMPSTDLRRWCEALDPSRAYLGRAQLARAVETALLTGRRLSALHRESTRGDRRDVRYLYVDPGPVLVRRIEFRANAMFEAGWPDEVMSLRQRVPETAPAWKAAGYGAVRAMVEGRLSRTAAHEQVVIQTRQYAKRQRTWFRHQLPPNCVTALDPEASDAAQVAERWWLEERIQ
ncbi:MAG: tRNA (adenosine(37)-N6)-dimethylallyltransferase MiaA [Gemmatimonadaceae bacterium]